MLILIVGYLGVYLVLGNMIADGLPSRQPIDEHGYSCGVSYCYNKLALKPWPFRSGRYYSCPRVGEVNRCTGEKWNGQWWYTPEVKR